MFKFFLKVVVLRKISSSIDQETWMSSCKEHILWCFFFSILALSINGFSKP